MSFGLLCLLLAIGGCEAEESPAATEQTPGDGDDDAAGDTDVDADTDADSDADTDADSDADSDADGDIAGCDGVDFLFVIDNSGSMDDEQQNLIDSFPGFIAAITETLDLDDFHIMAVDSDAKYGNQTSLNQMQCGTPGCCEEWCATMNPTDQCKEAPLDEYQYCDEWLGTASDSCHDELGAGHTGDNLGVECPIDGDNRYLIQDQADLEETFACIADVGVEGNGIEKLMEAMANAIGPLNEPDGCNAGFIRDEAILVYTFVTDEDEECVDSYEDCSEGDPTSWKQALVEAKGGDEDSVVVLGVFGDNDQPDGICEEYDPEQGNGAMPAPLLRDFLESFGDHGHYCSVCLPDYTDCFLEAVSTIDTTCEEYDPPE